MKVNVGQKPLVTANFGTLKNRTQFPYALLVPQSETEEILLGVLASLGIQVFRPFRASNLESAPDGIKVIFETGEVIRARYVVGADGSRSTVRSMKNYPKHVLNLLLRSDN